MATWLSVTLVQIFLRHLLHQSHVGPMPTVATLTVVVLTSLLPGCETSQLFAEALHEQSLLLISVRP